jgi:very-short-patch-repair endonuclease
MPEAQEKPHWQVTRKQRSLARSLRLNLTDVERLIWSALRAHRLNGASFRRQTPIGPYVVDFVSHEAKLVVELDGGQHFEAENMRRDARRDAFLRSEGFRVLRFNNHDVMTNRTGVLDTIAATLAEAPSPTLPRRRGRERGSASRKMMP